MRKIYVIGTLHNMMPKHEKELTQILDKINPDQILVEIVRKNLKSPKIRAYPKEMQFAYRWGTKHNKKVDGFDASIYVDKKDTTKKEREKFLKEFMKIINKYDWQQWNKKKYDKISYDNLRKLIDFRKHRSRQNKMLQNIRKMMIKDGIILILTGAGHLSFFERHLEKAIFPLRN